jgi:TonB family protein
MIKKTLLTIGIVLFSLMSYAQTVLQQAEKAFNACNYMDAAQLYDMQASTTGDETERTKLYDLANKCREIATLRTQANNAYKAKNYKTAMATYAKILKLNPKDKLAKNRKTECFDIINSVNVIVTADPQCDIYIDGEYKAKGSWEGRLFVKTYRFEARMEACEPSVKDVTLEKGNDVTITLDMPKQETTEVETVETMVKEEVVEEEVLKVVEEMPVFPGGAGKMMEYIAKNIVYPTYAIENGIQGRVFVTFVVERDGSISNVKAMRGIGFGCDEEAIRVIQSMPKWKPARQRGETVRCSYTIPIVFKM